MLSELPIDDLFDEPGPILWVGPTEGIEFGPCFDLIAEEREVEATDDLHAAAAIIAGSPEVAFDRIVLACSRPLVEVAAAESLVEATGPELIVQLLGTWCEGEGRTGKTLEGVQRIFWHQWPTWWRSENEVAGSVDGAMTRSVWVQSVDADLGRSLVATLASEGWGAVWSPNRQTVGSHDEIHNAEIHNSEIHNSAAIIWDGSQLGGREAARLAAVCGTVRTAGTPVVVLLDFPRPQAVATATALGAAAVLGKPFTQEALFDTLGCVIENARQNGSIRSNVVPSPDQAWSGLLDASVESRDASLHEAA